MAAPNLKPLNINLKPNSDFASELKKHSEATVTIDFGTNGEKACALLSHGREGKDVLAHFLSQPQSQAIFQKDNAYYLEDFMAWLSAQQSILSLKEIPQALSGTQNCHSIQFTKETPKSEVAEFFEKKIMANRSKRFQESAYLIFDELYMNAVIDAPYEFSKKFGSVNASSSQSEVELIVGFDNSRAFIFCKDNFGALDPDHLLSHIYRVYGTSGKIKVDTGVGQKRAGLGSFLMYETCLSMYLAVRPAQETLVGYSIPLNFSNRDKEYFRKNISVVKQD